MNSLASTLDAPTSATARIGAFFDVDNTLIPGSAIEIRFFRYLWRRRVVGWPEAFSSAGLLLRQIPPLSWHPLRQRKGYLAGKQPAAIEPLAQAFITSEIGPRLSGAALDVVRMHQRAGHSVVLLTGSLDFLIAPLARSLGIGTVLAARPESTEAGYTGRLLPPFPYGEGKRRLVEVYAEQQGLSLRHSYAYGDSPGDVETLDLVGHPLVVNPIRGMARIASRRGWPVTRWT